MYVKRKVSSSQDPMLLYCSCFLFKDKIFCYSYTSSLNQNDFLQLLPTSYTVDVGLSEFQSCLLINLVMLSFKLETSIEELF
jgi:hypothetical protein